MWRKRSGWSEEEGEERREMVVLTPNKTVLTGMPVGPPLSVLRRFFWIAQTHSCLFCYHLRVLPHRAHQPQCKQENMNTHTHTHWDTHMRDTLEQARVGGEREWGGWGSQGDLGPRGLSLKECCLYLETHISHPAKNNWVPPLTTNYILHPLGTLNGSLHLHLPSTSSCSQDPSILHRPPYSTSSPIVPLSVVVAHQHSLSPQPYPSFLLSPFGHTSRPSVSPVCFVTAGQSFSSRPY